MKMKTVLKTFSQDRMKAWDDLVEPKPEWELFKRLLPACDWNSLAVHERWLKPVRLKFKQTLDTEAPINLLDRFIIFKAVPSTHLTLPSIFRLELLVHVPA